MLKCAMSVYLRAASHRAGIGVATARPGRSPRTESQMQTHFHDTQIDVLLVEDNGADIILVKEAVRVHEVPITLHVAEDGERAMEFIERAECDATAPSPKIVLLDLNLPRRTGAEVLARLRQSPKYRHIPVIIVSSSGSERDRKQMEKLGASLYFQKPVGLEEFLKLGEILRRVLADQEYAG